MHYLPSFHPTTFNNSIDPLLMSIGSLPTLNTGAVYKLNYLIVLKEPILAGLLFAVENAVPGLS